MAYYPYQAAFLSDFITNSYLHGYSYLMGKRYIVTWIGPHQPDDTGVWT